MRIRFPVSKEKKEQAAGGGCVWGGVKKILKRPGRHIQVTHRIKWGLASVYAATGVSVAVSYIKDLLVG